MRPKMSVIIPYKNRLATLRVVFAALAEQTMDVAELEVLVGAMEHSPDLAELCRDYQNRLRVVVVQTADPWNVGHARNLALRNATGEVAVTLDADMALPAGALRTAYDRFFAHGQRQLLVGRLVGYDRAMREDAGSVEVLTWDNYRPTVNRLAEGDGDGDYRWSEKYAEALVRFPWAFVATGLTALPLDAVREHDLYFDEGFEGWGPEDQEWAFRVSRAGLPIVHEHSFVGLHLPHPRNVTGNDTTAWRNNRYYLDKWPRLHLEMALAFGWTEAAAHYPQAQRELAAAAGRPGERLGVAAGTMNGRTAVVVGGVFDTATERIEDGVVAMFDPPYRVRSLPLAGFGLPYADKSVDEVHVLPGVARLGEKYRAAVLREVNRVSDKVVTD